jgi:hypothetical protein
MKNLDYLDAYSEPEPEWDNRRYDNGNIGGVISAIIAWAVFLTLFFGGLAFLGSFI